MSVPGSSPSFDVAILGAGVMGLVTAMTAVRAGLRVAVFERHPDLTAGAGWRSGGMLAPECEADGASPAVVALGRRSMALWPDLAPDIRLDGTLVVAPPRDPASLVRFGRLTTGHRAVGHDEIDALEPALAGRFRQGFHYPGEGHLDPRATLPALVNGLETAGAPVVFGWSGDLDETSAARVVDARGLGARDRFPTLRGVKGEMALVRSRDVVLNRPVRLLHHRHPLYVVPRADGIFMIGATTIETDASATVTLRSAGELLTQAYALHPAFGEAEVVEFNAGLRPAMPDNEPVIAISGRTIAINGLYRHGWLIAPALAEEAMRLIIDPTTKPRIAAVAREDAHADHAQR